MLRLLESNSNIFATKNVGGRKPSEQLLSFKGQICVKDHVTLLGNAIFDHLTLQKSSVITVDGVQLNGVDHTLPGFCTKEMHYPTDDHAGGAQRPDENLLFSR